MYYNVAHI